MPLSRLLRPVSFDAGRFQRLLAQLMDNYIDLGPKLTAAQQDVPPGNDPLESLAAVKFDDEALARRVQQALDKQRIKSWPVHVIHGDLSLSNTILLPSGALVLVDWEHAGSRGLLALDLMRLLYDTWDESVRLRPKARQALMRQAKQTTRSALGRLGMEAEDYADIEALFVAQQFRGQSAHHADVGDLLRAYHQGAFALTEASSE
jgi:thiamine kinase-like enzyme